MIGYSTLLSLLPAILIWSLTTSWALVLISLSRADQFSPISCKIDCYWVRLKAEAGFPCMPAYSWAKLREISFSISLTKLFSRISWRKRSLCWSSKIKWPRGCFRYTASRRNVQSSSNGKLAYSILLKASLMSLKMNWYSDGAELNVNNVGY